jgi:murein DD-endopeptidase MepM/ murein hydrolase activator NlpD
MTIALRTAAGCLLVLGTKAAAQRLTVEPRQPSTGSLVRLTIDRLPAQTDSLPIVDATFAGEPVHFRDAGNGKFVALGAIPIDVSDSAAALVHYTNAAGTLDSLHLFLKYPHHPPAVAVQPPSRSRTRGVKASRLKVDKKFTTRLDSTTEARIEHENELARDVGHRAQDTPQLWTQSFLRPRPSKVTSRFGSGRVFNGRVQSSHLGIDYRGATGDPIYAANRGVVALVDSFFLAGNVVYIDHGDGVVTGYFHMSQPQVAAGDTVERGQQIGLVGATGRVTGPHLHWSARFGALTIDPADLLSLGAPFVEKTSTDAAASSRRR